MKFITFKQEGNEYIGVLSNNQEKVYKINELVLNRKYSNMNDFIKNVSDDELEKIAQVIVGDVNGKYNGHAIKNISICAPITKPVHDVLCVGLNYKDHVEESSRGLSSDIKMPTHPVYFSKRVYEMNGPNDMINSHTNITSEIDYEVEFAVIIGKEGRSILKENVDEYIFGYTIMNDWSARDVQKRHVQWFRGKSLDGFTSIGPYIVHKSAIENPENLEISCKINGEVRQKSNTSNFIFDIKTLISDLSQGMTLEPGDIIATGTPSGVGMGFEPQKYLKSGDVVECKIEKIGTLKNQIE